MKKTLLLLFTLLLALSAQSQNSLRLMTYNIKNANGMDDVCDFQRIADVINHIHPEVVALQELDSMTHRSGQKYVLGEIAGRTQMHAYFAPAIDYDGGKYGIGLLTKEIPVSLKTMTLPGREEARALIMAEFDNYIYCCTHLSLTEEDRMASLELIKDFAAAHKKPFFLAQSSSLCLTPVAPHSLNIRPVVINDTAEITLDVESRSHNYLVAIDGRSERMTEENI